MSWREPRPDVPPPPEPTDREVEAFWTGVAVWDSVLPPARERSREAEARRYCAVLMIHDLWTVLRDLPGVQFEAARVTCEAVIASRAAR